MTKTKTKGLLNRQIGYWRGFADEWVTAHRKKPEPRCNRSAMLSLADARLCGDYGRQHPRTRLQYASTPDRYDPRQTSLSHKLELTPTSGRNASSTALKFARTLVKLGLEFHVPLFPESFYEDSVTIWHLIWHDELTELQWHAIERLGQLAAETLEIEVEFEPCGHFHILGEARQTKNSLPASFSEALEELHPELMEGLRRGTYAYGAKKNADGTWKYGISKNDDGSTRYWSKNK